MKKKLLIVGGAGFIGHNMALRLSDVYEVVIVDSFSVNNYGHLLSREDLEMKRQQLYLLFLDERMKLLINKKIRIYNIDARDYHAISGVFERERPDKVIHLAAIAHANISNKNPYNTFDHSLRTLENSLDAANMEGSKVDQFIYFSSSMVYGDFKREFVTEETELNPKGIYGTLKICGEMMVKAYNQVFDLPYTIIRPSALYGPRCISRRVLQIFIENCLEGEPLTIQGDGSNKLDFTYIEDLLSGIELCLKNKEALNETYNLTYGCSASIKDVLDILNLYFVFDVRNKEWDRLVPKRGTLSTEKIEKQLGYHPRYPIDIGLERYIKWYGGIYGQ